MHREALKPQRNAGKSLPYTSGSWTLTCEGGNWDLEGASGLCKNFISQPRWRWQRCWPYHYLLTHVFVFVNSQTVCLCFMHFPVDIVFGQFQLSLKLRLTKTTVQERVKEKPTVRWPTAQATRNRTERKMSLWKQEAGRAQTYGIQGSDIHWAREALVRSSTGQWQEGCLIFLVLMGTGTGKSLSRFHQLQTLDGLEGPLEGKKRTDWGDKAAWSSLDSGNGEKFVHSLCLTLHTPSWAQGSMQETRDNHFNMHTLFFPTFGCIVWHMALSFLTRDQPHAHCSGHMKP